jgi:tetratricopeptide (TPR) repeat protein
VLLAVPAVAFYENKYLSVSLGLSACMALLWGYARLATAPSGTRALVFGLCAGLAVLGRPNLLLVLPCAAAALWLAGRAHTPTPHGRSRTLGVFAAGVLLALAPLALRNSIVTGSPTVLPSHGGGIPFFIGNNPSANGRWNDAGGLLGGQVLAERGELAERLGLAGVADPDRAIGAELYRRSLAFIRDEPASWLKLELNKLWYTLGNHSFVRDYDLLGERELLGAAHPIGLPFGIVLGLGALGLVLLARRARQRSDDGAWMELGLCVLLLGLLGAIFAANLLWFTSAQNRAPLYIPLAFASGPALEWLWQRARAWRSDAAARTDDSRVLGAAALLAALLTAQAFVPRLESQRPSSVHYYNLANAEEALGRHESALAHYTRATEQNPWQPMFWWRRALLARKMGRTSDAALALDRLSALPNAPAVLRDAARREQLSLARP